MNCEYGCGQEAVHQFKNGKWCCVNNHRKCPANKRKMKDLFKVNGHPRKGKKVNEESRKKMSESHKGQKSWNRGKTGIYSEESLKKMSESSKGQKAWNKGKKLHSLSDSHKQKLSKSMKGKKNTKEHNRKISESRIGILNHRFMTIIDYINKYPTFSKIEEMRYNPDKPGEKEIQVHCKNHNCINSKEKDGWFTPTGSQITERIRQLESINGNEGSYFYCSNKCKEECPLFGKTITQLIKEDQIRAGIIKEEYYTSEEYMIWRTEVLERANYKCEYCGEKANHAHHSRPKKLEPFFSLDPDFGIACCETCHYKKGHKDECSTGQLAYKVC